VRCGRGGRLSSPARPTSPGYRSYGAT
jgi:hypothetical protein